MDEKKLQSVHNLAVTTLFILLIFSGGFLWGEFKKVSKISGEEPVSKNENDKAAVIEYKTGSTQIGKDLFRAKCQRCHLVDKKMTGPPLMNVKDRWSDSTQLYSWIKNSQSYLANGDKYANDLFKEYKSIMPAFPELKEEEIKEILFYVDPE
ncbi:MAG: c-type cytochrome [Chitinophagales bacterium]